MTRMIQTNISTKRRLEIKNIVYNALLRLKKCTLPTKIKAIARSYENIRLIPYSKHMRLFDISYERMRMFAQTKYAFTDYYANEEC